MVTCLSILFQYPLDDQFLIGRRLERPNRSLAVLVITLEVPYLGKNLTGWERFKIRASWLWTDFEVESCTQRLLIGGKELLIVT